MNDKENNLKCKKIKKGKRYYCLSLFSIFLWLVLSQREKKMMRHHNPAHFLHLHNCTRPVTNTTYVTSSEM